MSRRFYRRHENVTVPIQDRKIDIRDLMAFAMLWDWAWKRGRVNAASRLAAARPAHLRGGEPPVKLGPPENGGRGIEVRLTSDTGFRAAAVAFALAENCRHGARFEPSGELVNTGFWLCYQDTASGLIEVWTAAGPGGAVTLGALVFQPTTESVAIAISYELLPSAAEQPVAGFHQEELLLVSRPDRWALREVAPNPFNPATTIRFDVPTQAHVSVEAFNLLGQKVRVFIHEELAPGSYNLSWDGTDSDGRPVASGVYVLVLRAHDIRILRRMLLVR